jgi:hypothetical protein
MVVAKARTANEWVTSVGKNRRWLLGLEPFFEGGWLHKGKRARAWDVEGRLTAVALIGDVTVDIAQARSAPERIVINAYAIFRDVDITVSAGDVVEMTGGGLFGKASDEAPPIAQPDRRRVVSVHAHTLVGDVTARAATL